MGRTQDRNHNYYGLGIAARHFVTDRFYVDTSVHAGYTTLDFSGNYAAENAQFETDNVYALMHATAGWRIALTDKADFDLYARYTFSYLEGDTYV